MWGFREKSTAQKLKQIADSLKPVGKEDMAFPEVRQPSLRTYIASPVGTIPGAKRVYAVDSDNHATWRLELGRGDVVIHQRDTDASTVSFLTKARRFATQSDPNLRINPVIRTAFNMCPIDIVGNGTGLDVGCPDVILFCAEDFQGDLYIVSVCPFLCEIPSSSSSSSSSSGSWENEEECRATEDVNVVTSVSFSGTSLEFECATLHFVEGKYCGSTQKGCGNFDNDDFSSDEQSGSEYRTLTINLCDIA
ncbi:MAG: hypothetical protein Q4D38_12205, partial [Planctomycetia bacterium]|nr:hypothetical protein [Planctomycetia bacterium]